MASQVDDSPFYHIPFHKQVIFILIFSPIDTFFMTLLFFLRICFAH